MSAFWGLIFERSGEKYEDFMERYSIHFVDDIYELLNEDEGEIVQDGIEEEDSGDYYLGEDDYYFDNYSIAPMILITKDGEKACRAKLKDVDWDRTFKQGGGFEFKRNYPSVDYIFDKDNCTEIITVPDEVEPGEGEDTWTAYIKLYAAAFLKNSPDAMVYAAKFHV